MSTVGNGKRIFELRLLAEGVLVGIGSGLVVSFFRFMLDASEAFREALYNHWMEEYFWSIPLYFAGLALTARILAGIIKAEPLAGGSGIPQVKGILSGKIEMNWLRLLLSKLLGAIIGIGAGLSLGRQGPSVQFGACVGQGIGRLLNPPGLRKEKFLIAAGAGAGLAAAFNAPLAGVIFCAEELSHRFSSFQVLSAMVAAATSTAVARCFFGMEPVFHVSQFPVIPLGSSYLIFIALGCLVGGLGLIFNRSLLLALDTYKVLPLNGTGRYLFPLLLAGLLGFVLPEILGGGNRLVDQLLVTEYELWFLFLLLTGKFLFTLLCFGSGAPGGIFLPMMALGAVSGAIFGQIIISLGWMPPELMECCIVLGMAAYFSGAVKSPISSSVLIMEITGSFDHMLLILCVSLSACMALDMTKTQPIYDAILQRKWQRKLNHN